jgi:hypothetical protein
LSVICALDEFLAEDFLDFDFEEETIRFDDGTEIGGCDWTGDLWLSEEEREADRRNRALILPVEEF